MREMLFGQLQMAGPWEQIDFFKDFIYVAKSRGRYEEDIDWSHYFQYYIDLYERKYGKIEWYVEEPNGS